MQFAYRWFFLGIGVWFLFLQTVAAQVPPYAKWGKLAVEETKKHYPQADIIDYLHIGRDSLGTHQAREKFRLLLRQNHKEWAVLISITFDTRTEKVISIRIQDLRSEARISLQIKNVACADMRRFWHFPVEFETD